MVVSIKKSVKLDIILKWEIIGAIFYDHLFSDDWEEASFCFTPNLTLITLLGEVRKIQELLISISIMPSMIPSSLLMNSQHPLISPFYEDKDKLLISYSKYPFYVAITIVFPDTWII